MSLPEPRLRLREACVLVVGDIMTDVIVRPEGPLVRGSDRRAAIRSLPGGSGANQAAWLAHFGVKTRFAGRVGAADAGWFRDHLGCHGVDAVLAADRMRPSGTLISLVDPDGERSFLTDRGANDGLSLEDLPDRLLDGVGLLHVSGYALFTPGPRAAVLDLMRRAREKELVVTVDPASVSFLHEVGPNAFLDWTRGAAICFPNETEAAALTGAHQPRHQREALLQSYDAVVIKRGAGGAEYCAAGVEPLIAPAPSVACIDSTGAGDAFLAGFLSGVCDGADVAVCLDRGNRAGAAATTHVGGQPAR